MAEQLTNDAPATGTPPTTTEQEPASSGAPSQPSPPGDESQLGDAGKRALEAERAARRDAEARLKDLEPLAAKAKELEDAAKSNEQRLSEELAEAKASSVSSATGLLQLEVALDHAPVGMDPARVRKLAGRLRGATREELEADASELFTEVGSVPAGDGGVSGRQTPVENLRPGALPTQPTVSLADQIRALEADGKFAEAGDLKAQQLIELHQSTS